MDYNPIFFSPPWRLFVGFELFSIILALQPIPFPSVVSDLHGIATWPAWLWVEEKKWNVYILLYLQDDFQDGQRDYGTDVGIYQGSRANFYPFDKRAGVENRFTVFRPTLRDHYLSLLEDKPWAVKEFKRQRISGGTTLSVDSSMDVIRQRLLNGLRRNQLLQKQRQIEHNEKLLTSIGKRQVSSQVSKDDVSQSESQ